MKICVFIYVPIIYMNLYVLLSFPRVVVVWPLRRTRPLPLRVYTYAYIRRFNPSICIQIHTSICICILG